MIGTQQQRNTSSIIIKPNVSDLAISKMQNITPIMKSPYKLMIFLLCLVLLKNNIGLFTSDSKGFTTASINNKVYIIALPIILDEIKEICTCIFKRYLLIALILCEVRRRL